MQQGEAQLSTEATEDGSGDEAVMAVGDVIAGMQARLQLCRRLAVATHDLRAGDALRGMAQEIEADIAKLVSTQRNEE